MAKLWIFFRADLPERKKRFPSWAGAEKIAADLNFGEKNGIFLRLVQTPTDGSDQPSLRSMRVLLKQRPKNEDLRPKTPWTKTKTPLTKTKTLWTKTKTLWTKTKTPLTKTKTLWTKTKTPLTKTTDASR